MIENEKVTQYILSSDKQARGTATELRALIVAVVPRVREELKWSRPCYALERPVCSFLVCKGHISLAFERGAALDDPERLLEGTGKTMRHVKIPLSGPIPGGVRALLLQAARF